MKKKIIIGVLAVVLIGFVGYLVKEYNYNRVFDKSYISHYKKPEPIYWGDNKTVQIWTGKTFERLAVTMASMLWIEPVFTQNGQHPFPDYYQIYKRFDDADYAVFRDCLIHPDGVTFSDESIGRNLPNILYLSFLDGRCFIIRFALDYETAILPHGDSKKLYTLFMDKPVSSAYDVEKDPNRKIEEFFRREQH